MTGISHIGGFEKYLGLPEKIEKKRKDAFEYIKQRIKHKDVQYVRNIRPSITNAEDKLIWIYTKTREYNVKSGYHLQRQLPSQNDKAQEGNKFIPENIKTQKQVETLKHMIYYCRVSKEVWDFLPTEFKVVPTENEELVSITNKMLDHAVANKSEMLNMFLGWRLWKMKNNIVFQQKREHILQVVHKAIRDHHLWKQKSQLEPSGIGWSLYSIQGIQLLQGSSSTQPTNSALEAEAVAVRMTAQQLRTLRFTNVTFFSDCKKVIDEIEQGKSNKTLNNVCITEAHTMIQDIKIISKEQGFMLHYISRIWLCNIDEKAKLARA
ncbi:hypothetical protein N665_0240s0005 [Sinapis alba]|nr:hypothetical protein N665_0240s0005 [Sinapis alba]